MPRRRGWLGRRLATPTYVSFTPRKQTSLKWAARSLLEGAPKSEVSYAQLRLDYHWHRTVRTRFSAAIGVCRLEGRDHRTQAVRRYMHQHRLHPHKDTNRERLRCTCCTPRR